MTAIAHDTILEVPLPQLHDSPFNARRLYTGLEELAASITAEGRVLQPLLVRPLAGVPGAYQLVFGHRRLRAAELASLPTVPCMVRDMTDAEVRSAQAGENLQRENVHAFEEAQGYRDMMDIDGLSADDIAARVGKSRSHVYARLKLLQACPEIRTACLEGKIGAETALLVARLRTPQLQSKALAAISKEPRASLHDGGKASYRAVQRLLAEKFTLDLRLAIFEPDDSTLVPAAGPAAAAPSSAATRRNSQTLRKASMSAGAAGKATPTCAPTPTAGTPSARRTWRAWPPACRPRARP